MGGGQTGHHPTTPKRGAINLWRVDYLQAASLTQLRTCLGANHC
ncbi:hypothetical protein VCR20J5_1030059 [Vibrio crassostreae]|nr:hypothetical protein VCR20J5_1030059 [Vibrio crassostreae]